MNWKKKPVKHHLRRVKRYAACNFWILRNPWKIFNRPFVVLLELDKTTVTACCVLHILHLNEMAILFRKLYRYSQITSQ
jgi:hypothetical protein